MLRSARPIPVILAVSLLGIALCANSADRFAHIEKIEWTWSDRPAAPDDRLPNVLLLGDSITRGYYEPAATLLDGKANVYLFATSAAVGADMLSEQIRAYAKMVGIRFHIVHLNNGMHGRTYTEAEYRAHYPAFIDTVKRQWPEAQCIVATTTPVLVDGEDGPTNARIVVRNAIAVEDAAKSGCRLDDQHALMLQHQDLHDGNVHYTAAGSRVQAEQAAASILRVLAERP
jgi:hypothetical protein